MPNLRPPPLYKFNWLRDIKGVPKKMIIMDRTSYFRESFWTYQTKLKESITETEFWAWIWFPGGVQLGRERGQRCTWLVTSDSCWLICSMPPIARESPEPRWVRGERGGHNGKANGSWRYPSCFSSHQFHACAASFFFQKCDKMETGRKKNRRKKRGDSEGGGKQQAGRYIKLAMLISRPRSWCEWLLSQLSREQTNEKISKANIYTDNIVHPLLNLLMQHRSSSGNSVDSGMFAES